MGRRTTAFLLALVLILLSGAEGCESAGSPNGGATPAARPTRYVTPRTGINPPSPNPDHGAKTPAPVAADPDPHHKHDYAIFVSWSPAREFVEIEWGAGADGSSGRERSGGQWSKSDEIWEGQLIWIDVEWTQISFDRLRATSTTGSIKIVITIDGGTKVEVSTSTGAFQRHLHADYRV